MYRNSYTFHCCPLKDRFGLRIPEYPNMNTRLPFRFGRRCAVDMVTFFSFGYPLIQEPNEMAKLLRKELA